jgi:delta 1-pyrroline-5-carboxylate dehydrogenase
MAFNYKDLDISAVVQFIEGHQGVLSLILVTLIVGVFSFRLFLKPSVPTVRVALPTQAQPGWTGKVLSNPSIYGKDPSIIQCYCPATGQLIDTLKAATTQDVDIAIEKAKQAQLKWRSTTFEQRKLVLRTLLKFILENQGRAG